MSKVPRRRVDGIVQGGTTMLSGPATLMTALFFFAVVVTWLFARQYYTAAVMMLVPLAFSALWLRPEEVLAVWPYFDPLVTEVCLVLLGVLAGITLIRMRNLVMRFVLAVLIGAIGAWSLLLVTGALLAITLEHQSRDSAFELAYDKFTTLSTFGIVMLIVAAIGGVFYAVRRH